MSNLSMKKNILNSPYTYRFIEIILPLLVWGTITMPIWLSPFHPALASYIIIAYFLYFLYKSMRTAYFATISYKLMQKAEKVKWHKKVVKKKHYEDLYHIILIVNYRESKQKLHRTIKRMTEQNYRKDRIFIVLGMEEREGDEARERSAWLTDTFAHKIGGMFTTYHHLLEGEVVGKASNATYAMKYVTELFKEKNIPPQNVMVSVCDADSLLPKDYLAYISYLFLDDADRLYRFYSAPVLLYNNFWKLSLPIRVQSILSAVTRFAYLSQRDDLIQISTYSTNLWLLERIGYWDTDIIPEDWHVWMQAFFALGEKVKTIPVYLPIVRDGVLAKSLIKTFQTRYEQERRWAWGASDIPYAIIKFFNSPHIDFWVKLKRVMFVTEVHFMWPTAFFLLTISASIPPLINPVFKRTVLGFLLPNISSFILTFASVLLIATLYFDYQLRKRVKIKTNLRNMPILFVQWYFLPLISFAFSSLPALEAHTRMLLGKKLEYKVTEKV